VIIVIGYLAFALNVIGNVLLAHKNILGWAVRLVTNVAWIVYAWQIEDGGPVVFNHAAFVLINLYGMVQWWKKRDGEKKESEA
jgi:nicotinamide riboside transporter PnuC